MVNKIVERLLQYGGNVLMKGSHRRNAIELASILIYLIGVNRMYKTVQVKYPHY